MVKFPLGVTRVNSPKFGAPISELKSSVDCGSEKQPIQPTAFLLEACEKHIPVVNKKAIRYRVRMVALLSSKWVVSIPGRGMVTGSIANICRWREAGILDHVPGEGIAVEGVKEGHNIDRRKWAVVIDSYPTRWAVWKRGPDPGHKRVLERLCLLIGGLYGLRINPRCGINRIPVPFRPILIHFLVLLVPWGSEYTPSM
jgi:hypothetical protein